MSIRRLLGILGICGMLAACAPGMPPGDPFQQQCLERLRLHDSRAGRQGVSDAEAARIEGFPFLRASRFLASFAGRTMDDAVFDEWLAALSERDERARGYERANLAGSAPPVEPDCRPRLIDRVRASEPLQQRLASSVRVDDAYSGLHRALGFYPLSKWLVWPGIQRLHRDARERFAEPVAGDANLLRYRPSAAAAAGQPLSPAERDRLGRLDMDPERLEALFALFAPVLLVETESRADRIGTPGWTASGEISVDVERPRVYRRLSHTRFQGRVLPQLNYIFWFPERPKSHALDPLGGKLDGLTWRLTLGEDGRVLLADSMHNCGCYHMFFPSRALQPSPPRDGTEPALIPARLPALEPGRRYLLRLSSGAHYIQRVATTRGGGAADAYYRLDDYHRLRSLTKPAGRRRSMFGADGLVAGSERLERFLLWPMGVPSAGAMRQWGHHATAFIGKRHFDDPDLLDRYFRPAAQ